MKPKRFFYHYNKPNKKMTVHFSGRCILVKNVVVNCPCETKWNDKKQPNLIMRGFASKVLIEEDTAYIT